VRIIEMNFTEAGNGKNYTDSLVQKQKLHIDEHLKRNNASARVASEMAGAAAAGQAECGAAMSCDTGEIIINRPSEAGGARQNSIPGIQGMYHFEYEYDEDAKFVGLRARAHEGLGVGKFFSAEECARMWKEEGLCQDLEPELKLATAGVAKEREGARLLRGDEHKLLDVQKGSEKRAALREKLESREREAVCKQQTAMQETGLHFCPLCAKAYQSKCSFDKHVPKCAEQQRQKQESARFSKIRPAEELEGSTLQPSQLLLCSSGGMHILVA
jgi:hypothetical protein